MVRFESFLCICVCFRLRDVGSISDELDLVMSLGPFILNQRDKISQGPSDGTSGPVDVPWGKFVTEKLNPKAI